MRTILIILLVFSLSTVSVESYPLNETATIITEKYPNAIQDEKIILQDDGNGIYVRYSAYPIPDTVEMDLLWQRVQEKRALETQNQTEKTLSKQDLQTKYKNQINNLNTVINNSNYIQEKTNWTNAEVIQYMKVLAWHDEVLAKGEIVILKILRWMPW